MQTPALSALQTRRADTEIAFTHTRRSVARAWLTNNPIAQTARGLFISSLLWVVLAVFLYVAYTLVSGKA